MNTIAAKETQSQINQKNPAEQKPVSARSFRHPLHQLQNTLGNRVVQRLIQAKLTVGAADDEHEREADRVAREVLNISDATVSRALRRMSVPEEKKDEMLHKKPLAESISPFVHRQLTTTEDEEELVQAKENYPHAGSFDAGEAVETQLGLSKGRGSPLPDTVRAFMEPRFGVDFGQVRVHADAEALNMTEAVSAQAFTHGRDVYFGAGHSPTELALTAHELTHVLQQTGGAPLQADRLDNLALTGSESSVQRVCGACAAGDPPCASCAAEEEPIQRKEVQVPSHRPVKRGVVAEYQRISRAPKSVQRYSWDEFTDDVASVGEAAVEGVQEAGSAVASGAEAVGGAVVSGAEAVGEAVVSGAEAVASGAEAVGSAVVSGAEAVVSGVGAAGEAVVSGVQGLVQAGGEAVDWLLTEAGQLALSGANAIAGKFGGSVTISPTGGIDITIGDLDIAEIEDETFVLPLGIPTETLFEAPFEVGSFVINAWVGTIFGDPTVTIATGPIRLQNILLHLDPFGGNYSGTAALYVGSAVSGSIEKAHEARLQAAGLLPFDPPIPIEGSAAVGIRDILRINGKEGYKETVTIGYSGGNFFLNTGLDIKLGTIGELDHEAFLRIEIETAEICSVIWPRGSIQLWDKGVDINIPFTLATGPGGSIAKIGTPRTMPISADAIETGLQNEHEPADCLSLKELGEFLCKKGKLPADICAIVSPTTPIVGPPVGPVPIGPPGGGLVAPLGPDPDPKRCDPLNNGAEPILTEGDSEHGRTHIDERHAFKTGAASSWFLENGTTMAALSSLLKDAVPSARGNWKSSEDRETPGLFHCLSTVDFGSRQVGWEVRNRNTDPPNVKPLNKLLIIVRSADLEVVTMFPIKK